MNLVRWFFDMSPVYLYIALFIVLAIEGTGLPGVPFEPLFIATGILIGKGKMDYWLAVFCGGTGNLAGNLLGYWIGATSINKLFCNILNKRSSSKFDTSKWQSWLDRFGPAVVLLSRWFGPIRTPTILAAGAGRMNIWSYLFFSAIGAYSWTAVWQWGSWRLTGLVMIWWRHHREYIIIAMVLASLILVPIAMYVWRYFRRKPVCLNPSNKPSDP
ncbi:MAG: DedA family protein [Bacillota bacterium]